MRKRLTSPRILEVRKEIGLAKSCSCNFSRSTAVAAFCFFDLWRLKFANAIQATYNIERFRSATSHGRDQEFLLTFGAESKKGSQIIPTSCLNLFWVFGECARTGGSSTAVREGERINPTQVGSKTARGANA